MRENGDLRLIFEAVPVSKLLSDIDGANNRKLHAWLETRFDGGLEAVRKDRVEPVGGLPADAPLFPYNFATLRPEAGGFLPGHRDHRGAGAPHAQPSASRRPGT